MLLGDFETAHFAGSKRRHHLLRLRLRTSCASQRHSAGDYAALARPAKRGLVPPLFLCRFFLRLLRTILFGQPEQFLCMLQG